MGLDGQCCIFDELIVCVRTVHVPTGYNYGNVARRSDSQLRQLLVLASVFLPAQQEAIANTASELAGDQDSVTGNGAESPDLKPIDPKEEASA